MVCAALHAKPVLENATPLLEYMLMYKNHVDSETAHKWMFKNDEDFVMFMCLSALLGDDKIDEEWLTRRHELEQFLCTVEFTHQEDREDISVLHGSLVDRNVDHSARREYTQRRGKSEAECLRDTGLAPDSNLADHMIQDDHSNHVN